jgi:hypothetical protein
MIRTALHLLLYTTILFGLCVYSATIGPRQVVSILDALANPAAFAGRELNLQYARVVNLLPQALQVQQRSAQINVQVPENLEQAWEVWNRQLQARDYVSLQAVFHPEGFLILRDLHVHEGRWLKIWASIFALFLLAGVVIYERRKVTCHHA